jgi:probable HAF family extracellular repeat protein
MQKKSRWILGLCLVWGTVFCLAGHLEAKKYLFRDLGNLGGSAAAAYAINDQSQVAGWAENTEGRERAFRWTPGNPPQMQDLGTLGGDESQAYGLNNAGRVVGEAATTSANYAFFWKPGNMQNLGTLDSSGVKSQANSINDAGRVVGSDWFLLDHLIQPRPFWWSSGAVQPLSLPKDYLSGQANAINQVGQVVGYYKDVVTSNTFACFWSSVDAAPQALGTFGGPYSYARDINDLGQVVGTAALPGPIQRAFIWSPGHEKEELGTLGLESSEAYAINNAGEVIGEAFTIGKEGRFFYWTRETGMQDLRKMVVNFPADDYLYRVRDINNQGEIVGETFFNKQAFILTPITGALPQLNLLLLE